MKHLREYLESRENTWNDPEWIKQYELKAKELQRARNEKIAQSKKKYCLLPGVLNICKVM